MEDTSLKKLIDKTEAVIESTTTGSEEKTEDNNKNSSSNENKVEEDTSSLAKTGVQFLNESKENENQQPKLLSEEEQLEREKIPETAANKTGIIKGTVKEKIKALETNMQGIEASEMEKSQQQPLELEEEQERIRLVEEANKNAKLKEEDEEAKKLNEVEQEKVQDAIRAKLIAEEEKEEEEIQQKKNEQVTEEQQINNHQFVEEEDQMSLVSEESLHNNNNNSNDQNNNQRLSSPPPLGGKRNSRFNKLDDKHKSIAEKVDLLLEENAYELSKRLHERQFCKACLIAGIHPEQLMVAVRNSLSLDEEMMPTSEDILTMLHYDILNSPRLPPNIEKLTLPPEYLYDSKFLKKVLSAVIIEYIELRGLENMEGKYTKTALGYSEDLMERAVNRVQTVRDRCIANREKIHTVGHRRNNVLLERKRLHHEKDLLKKERIKRAERNRAIMHQKQKDFCDREDQRIKAYKNQKAKLIKEEIKTKENNIKMKFESLNIRRKNINQGRRGHIMEINKKRAKMSEKAKEAHAKIEEQRRIDGIKASKEKQKSFEKAKAMADSKKRAKTSGNKEAFDMAKWNMYRKQFKQEVRRRYVLQCKIEKFTYKSKVTDGLKHVLGREQNRFKKQEIWNRHKNKDEAQSFEENFSPGPGTYLGPNAAKLLRPESKSGKSMSKSEVIRMKGSVSDDRLNAPGPGRYELRENMQGKSGLKFSTADVPGYIKIEQDRAKLIPGPSDYDLPVKKFNGGRFVSNADSPNFIDDIIFKGTAMPGPGYYDVSYRHIDRALTPILQSAKKVSRIDLGLRPFLPSGFIVDEISARNNANNIIHEKVLGNNNNNNNNRPGTSAASAIITKKDKKMKSKNKKNSRNSSRRPSTSSL